MLTELRSTAAPAQQNRRRGTDRVIYPALFSSAALCHPQTSEQQLNQLRKDQGSSKEAPNIRYTSHVSVASEGQGRGGREEMEQRVTGGGQMRVERRTARKHRQYKNGK